MIGISLQRKLNVRSRARERVSASKIDPLLWAVQIQLEGDHYLGKSSLLRRPSGTISDSFTDLCT